MEKQEKQHKIGAATYVIERVFTSNKTPQEVVAEEIITTAKKVDFFDHSGKKMYNISVNEWFQKGGHHAEPHQTR